MKTGKSKKIPWLHKTFLLTNSSETIIFLSIPTICHRTSFKTNELKSNKNIINIDMTSKDLMELNVLKKRVQMEIWNTYIIGTGIKLTIVQLRS